MHSWYLQIKVVRLRVSTHANLRSNSIVVNSVGSIACNACPAHSTSIVGSTSIASCTCSTGWNGPAGGPCSDVNECLSGGSGAIACAALSQDCVNTPGGYVCGECPIGLFPSAFTCVSLSYITNSLVLYGAGGVNITKRITDTPSDPLQLNSIGGGDIVGFQISPLADVGDITVLYGTPGKQQFPCNALTLVPSDDATFANVKCTTVAGLYRDMVFTVYANAAITNTSSMVLVVGTDLFSYPAPTIQAGTLRRYGSTTGGSTALVALTNFLPESILFEGANFVPNATLLRITYGPIAEPQLFECTMDPYRSSTTMMVCTTEGSSDGSSEGNTIRSLMYFSVQLNGGLIITGSDSYQMPVVPSVTWVRGCTNTVNSTSTSDCITRGGTMITICGAGFGGAPSAFVNGDPCTSPLLILDTTGQYPECGSVMTCYLPAGAGHDQSVVVSANSQFSAAVKLLSYANPVITSLTGCSGGPRGSSSISGCSRDGGDIIIINGTNFGPSGSRVFVASSECRSLIWISDSQLKCQTPPGAGLDRPVSVMQRNGEISQSSIALTYELCGAGLYANDRNCLECPPGTYAPQDSGSCLACGAGTITAVSGSGSCQTCPTDSIANGGITCDCAVGQYGYLDETRTLRCASCPDGASCTLPGLTILTLPSQVGYWRPTNSTTFFSCLRQQHCVGGAGSQCAAHRTGPLCSICEAGYSASSNADTCVACGAKSTSIGIGVLLVVVVLAALTLMFWFVLRNTHMAGGPAYETYAIEHMQARIFVSDTRAIHADEMPVLPMGQEQRTRPSSTFAFKILVTFLQISTSISSLTNLAYPPGFRAFISVFDFVNINFIPVGHLRPLLFIHSCRTSIF
jgi:hypothetical protein